MKPISSKQAIRGAARLRMTMAALALPLLGTAALLSGCGGGGDDGGAGAGAGAMAGVGGPSAASTAEMATRLSVIAPSPLSDEEASSLIFMREEEKLAFDVYAAMAAKWGTPIFVNIGASEQAHMDAVKLLLTRYGMPDPAAALQLGQFVNPSLQALYAALVSAGSTSLVGALSVGAEIEDVDIRDLRAISKNVDNADLLLVYANLEKGSRNHLRSFHDQLQQQRATYTPKYITQAEYDAIVNSPREKQ